MGLEFSHEELAQLKRALAELGDGLDIQNERPAGGLVTAGVGDGVEGGNYRRVLTRGDQITLREGLRKMSDAQLWGMFADQARKKNQGIPFDNWANPAISAGMAGDPTLTKALDSSGATALIRQDLEPIIYELYIRQFPAWERFPKEPANGLVHAYDRQTSFGDAKFMTELGTVSDDTAAYERATTPVSVIATRRGVSIKAQYAVLQSGSGFNPEQRELQAGLRAIAHKMQKTIFQGNATVSGASNLGDDEDGAYDANGFSGLRQALNTNRVEDVDPTGATPEDVRAAVNTAAITTMQNAGQITIAYLDPVTKGQIDVQQDKNVRYMDRLTDVAVGVLTNSLNTVFGPLPLFPVPGDSVGHYTRSATDVSDIYLLDEQSISMPYLGSDGPTVLDIPMGVSGQLTHLFIMFGMWGLAVKAPQFSNKVRVVRP